MNRSDHISIRATEVRPGMRIGENGCVRVIAVTPSRKPGGGVILEFEGGRRRSFRFNQTFAALPEHVDPFRDPPLQPVEAPAPTPAPTLSPHADRLRRWMDEMTPEQRKEHARMAAQARVKKNHAAVAVEREACARLCEQWAGDDGRTAEEMRTALTLARLIRGASLSTAHTEE